MKKLFSFTMTLLLVVLVSSCNKPMTQPENIACNPNPLTVVGNKVDATITGTFPAKYFDKKAVLEVTPVLKFEGKELKGASKTFVGEKAKVTGTTVNYKEGGNYDMKASFDYVPDMAKSELYLQFKVTKGKKTYDIPEVKIADGVINTAKLATAEDNKTAITPDKFQRIIQEMQEADIKFLIQQASLRSSETSSSAVKGLTVAMKEAQAAEKKEINKFEIIGYASPDGGLDLNTGLAEKREKASTNYMQRQLQREKINVGVQSSYTAEDWDGFQKMMEASNIQDKQLVLRVLSMYSDPEQREQEIKNLSVVYKNIADEILPQLRRARLQLTIDLIGKSDEEIKGLLKTDPKQLSLEEMLYGATLTSDLNEKASIYRTVTSSYPNDYRGYNNLGMVQYEQKNVTEAARNFAKALELNPTSANVNYNAGLAAMSQGDLAKAEAYLGKASGTTSDLGAALGTLYIMKGDYARAKSSFGSAKTNNAAVQQILNGDYNGARTTLAAVAKPNATTAYLSAVVGARTNDKNAVYSNLKEAVSKDSALKAKAAKDIEFAKFATDSDFQAILK